MIRPYVAVITDSFRSALSSRILWVAFVAIWLFLIALAPIGYHEDYTTTFRWFDLDNGTQMKAMLARGLVDPREEETALGRIARTFPDEIQRKLQQVAEGEDVRIDLRALSESLNESLDDESWYDASAWRSTVRLRELRELDEVPTEELSEAQRRRRARLRIEAALPGVFAALSARSITLSYAGFDFPAFFSIGKEQFVSLINQFVVPIIMDWLLGFALIFLGILVTASIIPEMLQPGSLHLLLSKPISRTFLLLSKFVGGCAFVLLCVCQLVVGLYLIAGFRLDIWNARILWCIPVAVFLFAVFFSVSLFAGLRWRSPILSVGVTCMFGAFVLVIGFVGGYFDGLVRGPDRILQMAFDDDQVVMTTRGGALKWFDSESEEWKEVIESDFRRRDLIVAPLKVAKDKMVTARINNGRFNLYGSGSLDLLLLDGNDDWEPRPGLRLPNGTRKMFRMGPSLIVMNNTGLMATDLEAALDSFGSDGPADDDDVAKDQEADGDSDDKDAVNSTSKNGGTDIGVTAWITDLLRMQGGATEEFHSILPQGVTLTEPIRLVPQADQNRMIVYSRGRLMRLDLPATRDGDWKATLGADLLLEDDTAARTTLAASGDAILMAREDEPIRWISAQDLTTELEFASPGDQTLLTAVGLGDREQFVILTTDGVARLVSRTPAGVEWEELGYSDVNSIAYDRELDRLVVAHNIDSLDFLSVSDDGSMTVKRAVRPTLSSWRSVDRYVITPLRTLTPQTGELGQTVVALVSGKSSFAMPGGSEENQEVIQLKIARPVLSCSLFTIVMLGLSCLYFSRRDF